MPLTTRMNKGFLNRMNTFGEKKHKFKEIYDEKIKGISAIENRNRNRNRNRARTNKVLFRQAFLKREQMYLYSYS